MAELTTLARPYAVAAYKRAKESGTTVPWSETLAFLSAVMADERLVKAAANPKVRREDFEANFVGLCRGHLYGETVNFVRLLIQNRRLGLVKQIAELFEQYKADDEGYVAVDVTTAFALEEHEESALEAALERFLRKQARLRIRVDEGLIGGVYIRAGDRVIDVSVRGQIERLTKSLWN